MCDPRYNDPVIPNAFVCFLTFYYGCFSLFLFSHPVVQDGVGIHYVTQTDIGLELGTDLLPGPAGCRSWGHVTEHLLL